MTLKAYSGVLALAFSVGGLTLFSALGAGRAGGGGGGAAPAVNAGKVIALTKIVPDGKPHTFELKDKSFVIDGEKTLLIAGEMHFGRILPEDFESRVKQAKALGVNVISFYSFWNLTEPEEGKFDFTGMNDIRRMFKICQDNGMWVVLRPGPYCCAEVDYGGIPYWTCKYPDVKIRTADPKYLAWSKRYIERVYKEVADFQVTKGGPLLMVQMENEYAMVARAPAAAPDNYAYMKSLHTIFKDAGFEVPLYVCDPGSFSAPGGSNPYGEGVFRGRNGLNGDAAYNQASQVAGDLPLYAPEVYTAWFSGWGQPIATKNAGMQAITSWTTYLLDHNVSWCYYVVFGGTNWGYNTGCNEWLPLQTTYDYGAPIDEAGRTNEKFRTLRNILATRTGRALPAPPAEPKVAALPAIHFTESESLLQTLAAAAPTKSAARPINMENLDQAYGFVLYRKQFPGGIKGKLELKNVMDYAVTMVNGKTVGKTFIGYGPESNTIDVSEAGPATLDILVENLGRISVITSANSQGRARKGLGGATLDGKELADWDMYSLPYTAGPAAFKDTAGMAGGGRTGPTFYHATFTSEQPASSFLNLSNFGMGIVWVNGHNLGRFWDRGGSRSLFMSEHFLKPGANEITILELHDPPKNAEVTGTVNMVETAAVPWAMRLDTPNPVPVAPPRGGGRAGGGA